MLSIRAFVFLQRRMPVASDQNMHREEFLVGVLPRQIVVWLSSYVARKFCRLLVSERFDASPHTQVAGQQLAVAYCGIFFEIIQKVIPDS